MFPPSDALSVCGSWNGETLLIIQEMATPHGGVSSLRPDGGSAPQLFPARAQPSRGTEQSRSSGCGTKTRGEGIKGAVNTQWPGGRTVSDAACASLLSKSELANTMAVGAAFEALRATLDPVSQTKNGGSFSSS